MSRRRDAELTNIEERLGYIFEDRQLLDRALTHSSAQASYSNERLEFLGDRVLGIVVAEYLFQEPERHNEGDMAARLNHFVRGEACAKIAKNIRLSDGMRSRAHDQDGVLADSILADAMEAVLAAVFLDGGMGEARHVVLRLWSDLLAQEPESFKDPKSRLQEYSQSVGLGLPHYQLEGSDGPDHAPQFHVVVSLDGAENARGSGASKRDAERQAAKAMLEKLNAGLL